MIPAQAVRDVFSRDAAFARAIVSELAERYRSVVRSLKNEKLRNSAERLANWILQTGSEQGNHHSIELPFDKRTLASRLGMTPENLSRNLTLLSKYGVRSSGRDIAIDDPSALEQFAKPNALIEIEISSLSEGQSHETRISWKVLSQIPEIGCRHQHHRKTDPHSVFDRKAERGIACTGYECRHLRKIAVCRNLQRSRECGSK